MMQNETGYYSGPVLPSAADGAPLGSTNLSSNPAHFYDDKSENNVKKTGGNKL